MMNNRGETAGRRSEMTRDENRRCEKQKKVDQRIGQQSRSLNREAQRMARNCVVNPCDRSQPPPVRRRGMDRPPKRRIFVVNLTNAHLPPRQHLLRLSDPFEAVVNVFWNDQLTHAADVSRQTTWRRLAVRPAQCS